MNAFVVITTSGSPCEELMTMVEDDTMVWRYGAASCTDDC
jgi:hypothetical protein